MKHLRFEGRLRRPDGPRPTHVVCCGMYRACSTWQYEIVSHLIETWCGGQRLGYLTGWAFRRLEPGLERPSVFKSHDASLQLERGVRQGRLMGIYAHRDLRDVVFSLMHKRGLSFRQIVRQGMVHQILHNDRRWRRLPQILVQRYDDLLASPAEGVMQIARHLGIDVGGAEAARLAQEFSRESNRARTRSLTENLRAAGVDLGDASSAQICDPGTLLHWNHLRDDGDGAWIRLATPRQRVQLERLCGRWLEANGYGRDREAWAIRLGAWDRLEQAVDRLAGRVRLGLRLGSDRAPRLAGIARRILGLEEPVEAHGWVQALSARSAEGLRPVCEPVAGASRGEPESP